MYKYPPFIIEDAITLSIRDIDKVFTLKAARRTYNEIQVTTINRITGNTEVSAVLYATVNSEKCNVYLVLEYEYRNQLVEDQIEIVTVESNLGKGWLYYFRCPVTGNKCRKLYLEAGHFVSRKGIEGIFYKQQVESKKQRMAIDPFRKYTRFRRMVDESFKPYYKARYEGTKTKKESKVEWASMNLGHMNRFGQLV